MIPDEQGLYTHQLKIKYGLESDPRIIVIRDVDAIDDRDAYYEIYHYQDCFKKRVVSDSSEDMALLKKYFRILLKRFEYVDEDGNSTKARSVESRLTKDSVREDDVWDYTMSARYLVTCSEGDKRMSVLREFALEYDAMEFLNVLAGRDGWRKNSLSVVSLKD